MKRLLNRILAAGIVGAMLVVSAALVRRIDEIPNKSGQQSFD
jgi:hypothetical protein